MRPPQQRGKCTGCKRTYWRIKQVGHKDDCPNSKRLREQAAKPRVEVTVFPAKFRT